MKKPRKRVYILAAIVLSVVMLPLVFCCGIPLVTGQACFDFLSGHVPPRAMRRYLEMAFEAALAGDDVWLSTAVQQDALADLKEIQPHLSTDFDIVFGDSLAGLYEYRVRFLDGTIAYVTLHGRWHQCPDLRVTDDEIQRNIELCSIRIDADWKPKD